MWITGKADQTSQKDLLFVQLYSECRTAAPGARLSYPLRSKLEKFPRPERRDIVTQEKDGCTPLFIACKKGNVDIVEYLLAQCGADVEQRGTYEVPDDRSIHHVTPLWCACVAGKMGVVKALVEHGAKVNSVSDTGSTPVRSACFMTHLEIVKYLVERGADILRPNYNGGTCLINSVQSVPLCAFLLQNGAAVNARDIQYKTALHYAIQEHRFEATKLLLEHGADPLMRSMAGDDALQTACLKGATQIFEHLIELSAFSAQRVAEAHELMGATYLDEHHDLPMALQLWRRALEIRTQHDGGPLEKAQAVPPRVAYQNAVEFTSAEELEQLALDLDAVRVQSLLICERILGPLHKDTIFRLMYRGAAYADSMQYQRCVDLWIFALRLRIRKDGLLHSEVCFTAQAIVRLFLDLLDKQTDGESRDVRFEDAMATVEVLLAEVPQGLQLLKVRPVYKRQQDNFDRILGVFIHLFHVMMAVPKQAVQTMCMKQLINRVIHMDPRNYLGDTLLHLAVSPSNAMKASSFFEGTHITIFPSENVVEVLLECGLVANVVNNALDTPLHVASRNYKAGVVKLLLNCGAHIDQRNSKGEQAYRLLAKVAECSINPLQYLNLKCLAAQIVNAHNIPFLGEVPVGLVDFIRLH